MRLYANNQRKMCDTALVEVPQGPGIYISSTLWIYQSVYNDTVITSNGYLWISDSIKRDHRRSKNSDQEIGGGIKLNESKSTNIIYPKVTQIRVANNVFIRLGMTLDAYVYWKQQAGKGGGLNLKYRNVYWLLGG